MSSKTSIPDDNTTPSPPHKTRLGVPIFTSEAHTIVQENLDLLFTVERDLSVDKSIGRLHDLITRSKLTFDKSLEDMDTWLDMVDSIVVDKEKKKNCPFYIIKMNLSFAWQWATIIIATDRLDTRVNDKDFKPFMFKHFFTFMSDEMITRKTRVLAEVQSKVMHDAIMIALRFADTVSIEEFQKLLPGRMFLTYPGITDEDKDEMFILSCIGGSDDDTYLEDDDPKDFSHQYMARKADDFKFSDEEIALINSPLKEGEEPLGDDEDEEEIDRHDGETQYDEYGEYKPTRHGLLMKVLRFFRAYFVYAMFDIVDSHMKNPIKFMCEYCGEPYLGDEETFNDTSDHRLKRSRSGSDSESGESDKEEELPSPPKKEQKIGVEA